MRPGRGFGNAGPIPGTSHSAPKIAETAPGGRAGVDADPESEQCGGGGMKAAAEHSAVGAGAAERVVRHAAPGEQRLPGQKRTGAGSESGPEADAGGGERLRRQEAVAVGDGGEAEGDSAGRVLRGHRERTEDAHRDLQEGSAAQARAGGVERTLLVLIEIRIPFARRIAEERGEPGAGHERARDDERPGAGAAELDELRSDDVRGIG